MRSRRGFTLVELMVALIVAVAVGAVIVRMLVVAQRSARAQTELSALQDNVRAGTLLLLAELREAGFDSTQSAAATGTSDDVTPDLLEMTPHRLRIRAMRGFSVTCASAAPSTSEITIRLPWRGFRMPTIDEDYLLFVERQTDQATDDEWYPLNVTSIDHSASCDGHPAIRLYFDDLAPAGITAAAIVPGSPVRAYEIMEYGLYSDGAHAWLGARSISSNELGYQPVVGPLDPDHGVALEYLNEAGTPAGSSGSMADRRSVRAVQLTLRGVTGQPIALGLDQAPALGRFALTMRVALRNTTRP